MRPRPIAMGELIANLAQGSEDVLEFDWLTCRGCGLAYARTHATRV
jgi:hypothetical protein